MRIDRETGERTHVIEPDGEFTVLDPDGNELSSEELPHCQHDPAWVDGPTGPDQRVLLYDNGNGKEPPHSRVAEYDIDLDARTVEHRHKLSSEQWLSTFLPGGVLELRSLSMAVAVEAFFQDLERLSHE